jgi:hypothetical protein
MLTSGWGFTMYSSIAIRYHLHHLHESGIGSDRCKYLIFGQLHSISTFDNHHIIIITNIAPQRLNQSAPNTTRAPVHASVNIGNFKPPPPNDCICLAPQSLAPSPTRPHELHRKRLPHAQSLLANVSPLAFACHWSSTKRRQPSHQRIPIDQIDSSFLPCGPQRQSA